MSSEAEVEAALRQFFHAMNTQDLALMERLVAHDAEMVHIGTDADEIWRGWDNLWAATIVQFEDLEAYDATLRDLTIRCSGDVAWYFHLLDARITGVFERREGRWKMVQTHVSLPEATDSAGPV
ncbi:MAG: DUF4440 domain-containing protein [Bacteroidetes bacterium]|jgi:ketosteroid isomerase-like protein|nr:DUF4440 domain-containing protein [Bacteroidota bacterium]